MPTGYLHGLFESIPGNETNAPTPSSKVIYAPLQTFTPKLNPKPMMRDDELRGIDEPIAVISEAYDPTWALVSRCYPDFLGFMLKLTLGAPVTTAGNGTITDPDTIAIPSGAYRHVWTAPFGPSGVSPLTAQFQPSYVDQSTFFKMKGSACSSLDIQSPRTGGVQMSAQGDALYMVRQANPSLTPAYEALTIRPFTRSNLTLPSWLSGTATHADATAKFTNPISTDSDLSIASKFPTIMEKDNMGPVTVEGTLDQRQLNATDWDALVAVTGFAATLRWVSDTIIASAYPYKFYIGMSNCQIISGDPEDLKNARRLGSKLAWKSTTPSAGSTTVTLVNATASYA